MPTVKCDNCGKEVKKNLYAIRNARHHFCSKVCHYEWERTRRNNVTNCDNCGNEMKTTPWRLRKFKHQFCSKKCWIDWCSKNKVITNCDQCGKEISINPSKINLKHHFCGRSCFDKWQSHKLELKCDYCGKSIKKVPSQGNWEGHFCDKNCYRKWRAQRRKEVKCSYCGTEIHKYLSRIGKNNFCNEKCYNEWIAQHRVNINCDNCGKEIEKILFEILNAEHHFCGTKCMGEYMTTIRGERHPLYGRTISEEQKLMLREFRKHQKIPTHHTKPEMIFEEICKNLNLPFKYTGDSSFWIKDINPDFVECNGKKIAVDIFGDYWHSPLLNPTLKEDRTLPYRRKKLKEYGWKLIIFWESDLLREDAEAFVLSQLERDGVL